MKIQAQISIYPLKTDSLSIPIGQFCGILEKKGLKVETKTMSSFVSGESDIVFESVQEAFEKLSEKYNVVMDLKVSNTCPEQTEENLD